MRREIDKTNENAFHEIMAEKPSKYLKENNYPTIGRIENPKQGEPQWPISRQSN